jgi:hypothetical protein
MRELRLKDQRQVDEFVADIVRKAEGVFLWVIIVVRSLARGLQNYHSIDELKRKLDEYPPELEDLYRHMLNRMGPLYRQQAELYFRIVLQSVEVQPSVPPSLLQMSFASDEDLARVLVGEAIPLSGEETVSRYREMDARMTRWCCGLIETHDLSCDATVHFLHKSVG